MGLWYVEKNKQALVKQFSISSSNFSNLHKHPSKGTDLDQPSPSCKEQPSYHHDRELNGPSELADRNTSPSVKNSLLLVNRALIPSDKI